MSDNEYEAGDQDLENAPKEKAPNQEEEEEEEKEGEDPSSSGRGQSSSVPSLRGAPEHEREGIIRRQNAEVRIHPNSYFLSSLLILLQFIVF